MIARRLIPHFCLSLVLLTTILVIVHLTAVRSIVVEVRKLLVGVATSAAEGLMSMPNFAEDFQEIDGTLDPTDRADPRTAAFLRMAAHLENIRARHGERSGHPNPLVPRIAEAYTFRRIRPTDSIHPVVIDDEGNRVQVDDTWQYVVDAAWADEDKNGNGVIDEDEVGCPPGLNYPEGLEFPMMESALQSPCADSEITIDQWGSWLSGYAPLLNEAGETIGILGVDLAQGDLQRKLLKIRVASGCAFLLMVLLVTAAFHGLSVRLHTYEELRIRDEQLEEQNRKLSAANREFSEQLSLAQRVQQHFLPADFPQTSRMAFGSIYLACEAVGGDIYDVFQIDDDHIGLYIADVSGHGISAALIGATLKMSVEAMKTATGSAARGRASILLRPRDMILRLHRILFENMERDRFVTMQYAVISLSDTRLRICNAAHTWPIWWHAKEGRADLVEIDSGLPIGFLTEDILTEQECHLAPGDKFVLYTDGLTESMHTGDEEMFGEERLRDAVASSGASGAQGTVAAIKSAVDQFSDGRPSGDDVAIIVAEVLARGDGVS